MLLRIIAKVRSTVVAIIFSVLHKHVINDKDGSGKVLFLDIGDNPYGRYLYSFLKFFHMEGYTVYMPKGLKLIRRLQCNHFTAHLLREKIVNFGKPPATGHRITIDKKRISLDYFSEIRNTFSSGNIHVPMAQHPLMYYNGWWNAPLEEGKRKKSIFMAGNFDAESYRVLEKDQVFGVMSRPAVYAFLEKRKLLHPIEDKDMMLSFLDSGDDGKIILLNRRRFDIPMWHLRWLLNKFEFYFALPGIVMPFSHNIIEAMSAGAIPFMQEEYAGLFIPVLEDEIHAVTFKGPEDLETRLDDALHFPQEKISFMREKIYAYYHEHLTPQAVVKRIEKAGYDNKIYLQAEEVSVKIFKDRLRTSVRPILSV